MDDYMKNEERALAIRILLDHVRGGDTLDRVALARQLKRVTKRDLLDIALIAYGSAAHHARQALGLTEGS